MRTISNPPPVFCFLFLPSPLLRFFKYTAAHPPFALWRGKYFSILYLALLFFSFSESRKRKRARKRKRKERRKSHSKSVSLVSPALIRSRHPAGATLCREHQTRPRDAAFRVQVVFLAPFIGYAPPRWRCVAVVLCIPAPYNNNLQQHNTTTRQDTTTAITITIAY